MGLRHGGHQTQARRVKHRHQGFARGCQIARLGQALADDAIDGRSHHAMGQAGAGRGCVGAGGLQLGLGLVDRRSADEVALT